MDPQGFVDFQFCPYLDFWTCGTCSQAHFKISCFAFLKVNNFEKTNVEHVCWKFTFVVGFMVSQPCASVSELPAALRRPQKKHAPGFWNMHFVDVVFFERF